MRVMKSAVALFTLFGIACSQEPGDRGSVGLIEPSVRDSAGVRIVENGSTQESLWRVGSEPLFTVGWEEDGPLFTWPQSGRILPDGGALVGEFGEGAVYRLGPDGSIAETWGRKGEGPGEYQALDAVLQKGDSTLVSDGRLRRVTLIPPQGAVRTIPLPLGTLQPRVAGIMKDGRFLVVPGEGYAGVDEVRPAWVFQTQPILAYAPSEGTIDTIAELPHLRRWYGGRGASPGPVHVKGRAGSTAEGFAWARSDEREVRWYDDAGQLLQVSRWEEDPAQLTAEWRDGMRGVFEEAYSSMGAEESMVMARLADLEDDLDRYEGHLPYWEQIHVDRIGNAWLSAFPLTGQAPERWRVLAREGAFKGWVDLPGVLTILDITDNRILAVRRDEFDVPAVLMFELVKH